MLHKNQPDYLAALNVYNAFSKTIHGKSLKQKARYDRFRPEHYSVKHWQRLLGKDVNNLHHMHQTILLAQDFLDNENHLLPGTFFKDERMLLSVTAALHDQAEAIIGDIPHGKETLAERANEIEFIQQYESAFAPHIRGNTLNVYRQGRDEIAFNQSGEKLPSAFRSIEHIGFAKNAMDAMNRIEQLTKRPHLTLRHAYLGIHTESRKEEIVTMLKRLFADVFSCGVFSALAELSQKFRAAEDFLITNKEQITHGFESINNTIFDWYEDGNDKTAAPNEAEKRKSDLESEKKMWHDWISQYE